MEKLKFKTSINCNGCKSAVAPFLDRETTIYKWEVDINNPDKILKVEGENIKRDEIITLIKNAGFNIEEIS
jgi:copper chaperone